MNTLDTIRAWKDPEYRNTLTADELAQLPPHPAGAIELTDDDLQHVVSGALNSGVRNVRWPSSPSEPDKPDTPNTPSAPRWRTYRPRNSTGKGYRR